MAEIFSFYGGGRISDDEAAAIEPPSPWDSPIGEVLKEMCQTSVSDRDRHLPHDIAAILLAHLIRVRSAGSWDKAGAAQFRHEAITRFSMTEDRNKEIVDRKIRASVSGDIRHSAVAVLAMAIREWFSGEGIKVPDARLQAYLAVYVIALSHASPLPARAPIPLRPTDGPSSRRR